MRFKTLSDKLHSWMNTANDYKYSHKVLCDIYPDVRDLIIIATEAEQLRADIQTHVKICADLATENERLRLSAGRPSSELMDELADIICFRDKDRARGIELLASLRSTLTPPDTQGALDVALSHLSVIEIDAKSDNPTLSRKEILGCCKIIRTALTRPEPVNAALLEALKMIDENGDATEMRKIAQQAIATAEKGGV